MWKSNIIWQSLENVSINNLEKCIEFIFLSAMDLLILQILQRYKPGYPIWMMDMDNILSFCTTQWISLHWIFSVLHFLEMLRWRRTCYWTWPGTRFKVIVASNFDKNLLMVFGLIIMNNNNVTETIYCQNRNGYLDHGFKSISMVLELALLREAVIGTEP